MPKKRKLLGLALFVTILLLLWIYVSEQDFLTFAYLKSHHRALVQFVTYHFLQAAGLFILIYITTGLLVPGALILTIAGGALFGTVTTALLVTVGALVGAIVAFGTARYLVGGSIQDRYGKELRGLNQELATHGHNYLLTLRIVPVLPAFVVNYLAGLTNIPFRTFVWTTSVGVLPGALVYAYAGSRLGSIQSPDEIMTWPVVGAFALMGGFSLLPVIMRRRRSRP